MQSDTPTAPVSKTMLWAGYVVSALPVLVLIASGVMKIAKPDDAVKGFQDLGNANWNLKEAGGKYSSLRTETLYKAWMCG